MKNRRAWCRAAMMFLALALAPNVSSAQLGRAIKERAAKKVAARKEAADSTIMHAADKAVDSTLEKTGRGVDNVVDKSAVVLDTVMNRTESGVATAGRALTSGGGAPDRIATDLATGRAVIRSIVFAPGSDQPSARSEEVFKRLARALGASQGTYLIEGHVDATSDPAADQALSQRRAASVKARLVAAGVAEGRLFTMGFGSQRPATDADAGGPTGNGRIEVAKMQ